MIKNFRSLTSIGVVLAAGSMNLACDEIQDACDLDLKCSGEGVVDGNASISGDAAFDSFFSAVVNFNSKATAISSAVNAELGRIALSLGLEGDASVDDITAALEAKLEADLDGGITIKYEPVRCEASIDATLEAAAKCDATVKPGELKAECSGTCEAKADVELECTGEAKLVCKGTAPDLKCAGECTGSCELNAEAKCEGECKGTCEVELEVAAECSGTCKGTCELELDAEGKCDGECSVELGADGTCGGTCSVNMEAGAKCEGTCEGSCDAKLEAGATCEGSCTGSCELKAGAECDGQCKGECAYTPPSGECEGGAKVECTAEGSASVECEGSCNGSVEPPEVSAECQASAKAEANINVECTPPSLEIGYEFNAELDAKGKAEFEAFVTVFADSYANILAQTKRLGIVIDAGADLVSAAEGAVKGSIETTLEGDLTIRAAAGLNCAIKEIPKAVSVLADGGGKLEESASATAAITGVVSGDS